MCYIIVNKKSRNLLAVAEDKTEMAHSLQLNFKTWLVSNTETIWASTETRGTQILQFSLFIYTFYV